MYLDDVANGLTNKLAEIWFVSSTDVIRYYLLEVSAVIDI